MTFTHVEPIFLQRCAYCHSDGGILGSPPEDLRIVSYETVVGGGERVVIVPGRPEASELLRRILGQALPRMPFDGPPFLDEEQTWLIREWIARGAPDSQGQTAPVPAGGELRLHGILTERWALDGLPLVVTSSTRIDGEVVLGAYVEVRGVLGPNGEVLVERIRER